MPIKRLTVYECSDSSKWKDFEEAKKREALLKRKNAIMQQMVKQSAEAKELENLN